MNLPELQTLAIEPLDGGLAVLRVNRPDRMNAQTVTMFHEYGIAARALRDSGLRALILTGAGDRAFCAGFDLGELDVITRFGVRDFLKFQETAAGCRWRWRPISGWPRRPRRSTRRSSGSACQRVTWVPPGC